MTDSGHDASSQRHSRNTYSEQRWQIVEEVDNGARNVERRNSVLGTHKKHPRARSKSSDHHQGTRPHHREEVYSSDDTLSEDTGSESTISSNQTLLPSLKLPFKFRKPDTKGKAKIADAPIAARIRSSPEKKDYRSKLYDENVLSVVHSRYTDGIHGREGCIANLFVEGAQDTQSERPSQLLQWIQIKRKYPSLDSFIDYVSQLDCLEEGERKGALSVMSLVRDRFEKQVATSKGKSGKYTDPNVTLNGLDDDADVFEYLEARRQPLALFFCMPYFCLAPYSTKAPFGSSSPFTSKTLLQSWRMSTPKQRDMQQAVCGLQYTTKGHVFHVPQVWCLIIGNSFLITCTSSHSDDTNQIRNEIRVHPMSAQQDKPHLRVSDGADRLWLLAISDCSTWLEFIANFRQLSLDFENQYEVLCAGEPQDASSWPSLLDRAQHTTLELRLRTKTVVDYDDNDSSSPTFPMFKEESISSDGIFDSATGETSVSSTTQVASGPQRHEGQDIDTARETRDSLKLKNTHLAASDEKTVFSWFAAIPDDSEARNGRFQDRHLDQHNVANSKNIKVKREFGVDEAKIEDTLAKMHSSLSASSFRSNGDYRRCPSGTVEEVNATLERLRKDEETHQKRDQSPPRQRHDSKRYQPQVYNDVRGSYSTGNPNLRESFIAPQGYAGLVQAKSRFFHIMKALFQTFLPIDYTSDMVAKYWGAVNLLLQDSDIPLKWIDAVESRRGFPHYATEKAGDIWHCKLLVQILCQLQVPSPFESAMSEHLMDSWVHLVMFLVLSAAKHHSQAFSELVQFRELAYGDREELMRSLAPRSLHRREAVLPFGIMSMLVKNLLGDVTLGAPNITDIYIEAFDNLREEILSKPYNRDLQKKLFRLRLETDCVHNVLYDQLYCVGQLQQYVGRGIIKSPRSFQRERETYVLRECMSSIHAKLANFRRIREDTSELAIWNTKRIDLKKSHPDAAVVYAVTAMTIIFSSMSFISSMVGMNTTDIPNTDKHQWVFWATAVPIAVLVIGLSLLVFRYLESAREALSMFTDSQNFDSRGIVGSPSQQHMDSHHRQVDHNKAAPGPILRPQQNNIPTYIKVHRKWISPSTVDEYQLPWEWDDRDSNYLIIKHWIPEHDQEILFEHTRRLRERRRLERTKKDPGNQRQRRRSLSPISETVDSEDM